MRILRSRTGRILSIKPGVLKWDSEELDGSMGNRAGETLGGVLGISRVRVWGHGYGGLGPVLPDQVTDLQPPQLLRVPRGLLILGFWLRL